MSRNTRFDILPGIYCRISAGIGIPRQAGAPICAPDQFFASHAGIVQGPVIELGPEPPAFQIDVFVSGCHVQGRIIEMLPPSAFNSGVFQDDGDVRISYCQGMGPEWVESGRAAMARHGVSARSASMVTEG